MKKLLKNVGIALIAFLVISGLISLYTADIGQVEQMPLNQLAQEINQGNVERIEITGNKLEIQLKGDRRAEARKEVESSLSESLSNVGVDTNRLKDVQIEVQDTSGSDLWLTIILPFLLPFLLIAFFIWFLMKQAQRGNSQAMMFGSSKARMLIPTKDGKKRITFQDVAGSTEAKEELYEVVEFLKYPKKFMDLGARIPRGFLLLGPPGTGKTLLSKAVAGEANVPFFSISGSEFVEMFVGVGASRVRDLFKQAKKHSPAIIFIDEIDAVGRHRGAGLGGGNDEREQTLNQILVEMDGFDTDNNVIVLAATNRPDVLDPALLRPGRFDRRITIDNPDIKERESILKIHTRDKRLEKEVNLKQIAERTPGFSGADLANLVNEAAILSARRNKKKVGMTELREAIEKVLLGPERKSHVLSEEEKKITAYHEGGHAILASVLPNADPVQKVSIVSRGHAAGYTLNVPIKDRALRFKSYYLEQICVLLAGYATEKRIFGEVTTGASNDLERATNMARKLVTQFGMSELGPIVFGKNEELVFLGRDIQEKKNYSEKVAEQIDGEVEKFIREAYERTEKILEERSETLERITHYLLERETLEKEDFDKIMKGEDLEPKKEKEKEVEKKEESADDAKKSDK